MLEATEDGTDERPASPRRERSPAAVNPAVEDRMVYKLVKVGDDGSVLAATDDEVFQSLVGGSGSGLSSFDPEGSEGDEDEDEEGSEYVDSDGDESDGKDHTVRLQDLASEREKLRARLEVLDSILEKADGEEKPRSIDENLGEDTSPYLSAGEGSGDHKRQRRPNPKYLDFEAGDDSASGRPAVSSSSGEPSPRVSLSEKTPTKATTISPRLISGWGSHRSSVRSASTHRARAADTLKPLTKTLTKVTSPGSSGHAVSTAPTKEVSLDNLSIRELHEAFRSTYGRGTSVKDKHWLKRQIFAGWRRQEDAFTKSTSHQPVHSNIKARLDHVTHAEQPLPSAAPAIVADTERKAVNDAKLQGSHGAELSKEFPKNRPEGRSPQRRTTTPAVLATSGSPDGLGIGSLNGSGAAGGQLAIYGKVAKSGVDEITGEPVGSKRQRKPNRRYIEDEAKAASGSTPDNDTRSADGDGVGNGLDSATNFSWRTVETDGPADMMGRHGTLRGSTLRNAPNKKLAAVQWSKPINGGLKRKVGDRAAKLVKMAQSTARSRQDIESGVQKDVSSDLNGGAEDQSSSLLPALQYDPSAVWKSLPLDNRPENEQPIVTVPTANGGTRRKHHRPWTLREVMMLVEGVARCGGGKWADIKKLSFATVSYRTAVDLKDKWRNLLRASRAQLHPAKQGERKKQFTAAIPAPILARVRELAALQNQIPPPAVSGSSTSRSGRTVHKN